VLVWSGARRAEKEVTMLIARPTTLAGSLPLNRIPVRPIDIALSAEPAASTG
jgi:hypothetical protein